MTIRLHANEHPEGPPVGVSDALHALTADLHRYPHSAGALEMAIAKLHNVPLNRILIGAGSAEIISLAWRAFTRADRAAVFREPEFELYSMLGTQCGTPTLTWPRAADGDLARYVEDMSVGLVALSNPHNPTGAFLPRRVIRDLATRLSDTTIMLNDEAYYDYANVADDELALSALSELPNVLTTKTFSKIHGLAGARIGYGIGTPSLIGVLRSLQTPFSVTAGARAAAVAALADPNMVVERRTRNRRNREALAGALAQRGFEVSPSQANFLFVRPPQRPSLWTAGLLDRGVRIQPAGEGLRVTVGSGAEVAALITAVDEVLISVHKTVHL